MTIAGILWAMPAGHMPAPAGGSARIKIIKPMPAPRPLQSVRARPASAHHLSRVPTGSPRARAPTARAGMPGPRRSLVDIKKSSPYRARTMYCDVWAEISDVRTQP